MRQLFQYHETVGYHFVPGLTARVLHESGGYLIRVNSLGFRSTREFKATKSVGTKRVLVFGDSFTSGDGVPNEKRYTDVLEDLIPGLEIYNFAVSGTGTDQQYLTYREFAGGFDHDLLVLSILVDNIRRLKSSYRPYIDEGAAITVYPKPYFELVENQLALRNVPVRRLSMAQSMLSPEESQAFRRLKGHGRRQNTSDRLPEYDDPLNPLWLLMRAILWRWIREHPKPVLVMPIPLYQFVEEICDPGHYAERFRELCVATGALFHDPLQDLRQYTPADRRGFRFSNDIHFTRAGHLALAMSLRPVLATILGKLERLPRT